MIIIDCEQGTEEWLQARAGACTASRFVDATARVGGLTEQQAKYVAALRSGASEAEAQARAGYQKKPSFSDLQKALAGEPVDEPSDAAVRYAWLLAFERITGMPLDDTYVTYAMRRGQELEPVARALYEERYGCMVEESGVMLTDDRLFGYSTDGQVFGQQGGIEIKCPMATDKLGAIWSRPDMAEEEYLWQIDGGMWISGWEWIDLVVYCPWLAAVGKDLFVKRIWRDDNRIEQLESKLWAFMQLSQSFEAALRADKPVRYERLASARLPRHEPGDSTPPWDAPAAPSPTSAAPVAPKAAPADLIADPFA